MTSARDTDQTKTGSTDPNTASRANDTEHLALIAAELARLTSEMSGAANPETQGEDSESSRARRSGRGRHRERGELETLRGEVSRWSGELERLLEICERLRSSEDAVSAESISGEREKRLERELTEKEEGLRSLRDAAAYRELDLQRARAEESQRLREEISALKSRLGEAESVSDGSRNEELREAKRLAYERESELRRTHASKLSEIENEAERRVSALRAQKAADNRSLLESHATERARIDEELESLRLRRLSEFRVYGTRIEELAHERAAERTSLEEAVAKLREKHESERARLQSLVDELEESLAEQESITAGLLGELGYVYGPERPEEQAEPGSELEVSDQKTSESGIREALGELRSITDPANLLREGISLFNDTEHANVVEAISKSLGEPEVYVALEPVTGGVKAPVITLVWPGIGWRRYACEPRSTTEPKVYLTGYGDETNREALLRSGPNARLDGRGTLSLGVRPL